MRARSTVVIAILLALFLGGGSVLVISGSNSNDRATSGDSSSRGSSHDQPVDDAARAAAAASFGDGDSTDRSVEVPDPATAGANDPAAESPSAAVPEDSPYRVGGTVVAADGRELSGVHVQLHPHRRTDAPGGAFEQLIDRLGSGGAASAATIGSARTDRFGNFDIPAPGPGEYRLTAELPPLARGLEGPFRLTEREPRIDLLFVLGGGLSIEGVVEGSNGRGIAGATISLLDRLEGELPGRHYHAHETTSRSDGSFRFDGLEPRRYILTATAAGSARALLPAVTPPLDSVLVTLDGGQELQVRVVDGGAMVGRSSGLSGEFPFDGLAPIIDGGTPIAGARVYALNPVGFASAETDADGIATLVIGGDNASLRVTAPGYREGSATRVSVPTALDPDTGLPRPSTVALIPIEEMTGTVVRSDGSPAGGAELLEVGFGLLTSGLKTFSADAEGRFSYSGSGSLLARLGDEVGPLPDGRGGGSGDTITLRPTAAISGRLVGPGGWPVVGGEVRLSLTDFTGGDSILLWSGANTAAVTGVDGRFTLAGIPDWGSQLELVIYADGSPDLHLQVRAGADLGEIVLGEEALLTGVIRTPGGGAPSAAAVILELDGAPPVRRDPGSGVLRGGERVVVAEDGSFAVGRLAPTNGDPLVLHVVAPPYLERTLSIDLVPGENGPLTIELASGGAALVRVEDDEGVPRAAVAVSLDGQGNERVAYTGADGIAHFAGLTPATYQVSVRSSSPSGARIVTGAEPVEVVAGEVSEVVIEVDE